MPRKPVLNILVLVHAKVWAVQRDRRRVSSVPARCQVNNKVPEVTHGASVHGAPLKWQRLELGLKWVARQGWWEGAQRAVPPHLHTGKS